MNGSLAAFWWSLLVEALISLFGVSVRFFGELPDASDRSVILISNHQSLMDPLVILIFAKKMKSLSYLKWFVKDSIRFIPFLGWGLWFIESIFLKRRWDEDMLHISKTFRKINSHQDPVWLISFVEGTRLTPEKLIQSQSFARDRGVDPFHHVLFPRYKGFDATLEGMACRIREVYDLTIRYESSKLSLCSLLRGKIGKVDVFFEKADVSTITKSSENQKGWLIAQFKKKDKLLSSFRRWE
jgi:1-acyl-sn-glycerol-3-phosphate acyltransferase